MKLDKVLKRFVQPVRAIRTYNSKFTIHSTDEMGEHNQDIIGIFGSGDTRLLVDLKKNRNRGKEIDLVFMGEREVRKNWNPKEKENWSSFGHIILSKPQAIMLSYKLRRLVKS